MSITRWWHRKGFGIQSPWAFTLVTTILAHRERSDWKKQMTTYLGNTRWTLISEINGKNKKVWKELMNDTEATALFDMKDEGLAVYDPKRYKMIYKI